MRNQSIIQCPAEHFGKALAEEMKKGFIVLPESVRFYCVLRSESGPTKEGRKITEFTNWGFCVVEAPPTKA